MLLADIKLDIANLNRSTTGLGMLSMSLSISSTPFARTEIVSRVKAAMKKKLQSSAKHRIHGAATVFSMFYTR